MRIGHQLKKLISWIACAAILMGALAPAISHALQAGASESWTEICSMSGARMVPVEDGAAHKPGPAEPADHLLKHCPYCSLHVSDLGLPPAPSVVPPLSLLAFHLPALFLSAPRTLFAWRSAQPRAPPASLC